MIVDVERVAHGGSCVGRAPDGRVVFVRHTLPGERVRVVVTDERKAFLRADAVEVLVAAPGRVDARCAWSGPRRCGGCDWQHVELSEQRRLKAAVVREQLQRLAGIEWPVDVVPAPGDNDGLGWRTRMRFAVDADGVAGLHRHRSSDIERIGDCLIAHPAIDAPQILARRWPPLDDVTVDLSSAGVAAAGRQWQVPPGGFWQVHPGAADALVDAVLAMAAPAAGERCLDLYGGVGLFAGVIAPRVAPSVVTVVELDARAAAAAAANLADLDNVEVVSARVERWLRTVDGVELVVLDPPRAGAGRDVVRALARCHPRAIVYVACDPASLARDIATLRDAGYRLTQLRAFDLFPMTSHVECVALLEPA